MWISLCVIRAAFDAARSSRSMQGARGLPGGNDMNGLWQRAADRIRDELGQVGYETWIGPLNFIAHQGSTVTIEAPNRFFRDWINERYLSMMRAALSKEAGEEMEVRLTLGENAAVATPPPRPTNGHVDGHANSNGKSAAANRATAAAA